MSLPAGVTTGLVTGTFNTLVAGASVPVDGMLVVFTPSSPVVLDAGATQTLGITAVTGVVRQGILYDASGAVGVTLVATDSAGITPTGFTWLVQFQGPVPLGLNSFSFALPGGTTKDLATISPVPPVPGVPSMVATDAVVAGYATGPGLTRAFLDGQYAPKSGSNVYETQAHAAATYAPVSGSAVYESQAHASSTYQTQAGLDTAQAGNVSTGGSSTDTALKARYASVLTLTGVGNEDAKINTWLAANSPLGVKKLVGSGTLGASISPPAGTYLDGTAASLILANNATWNAVTVLTGADDVTVVGLTLDGNRANTSYGQNGLYTVAARTKFLDCHVKNFNGYNIVGFPGATDLLVRGCVSEGPASEGIEFQGVVRGAIVNNIVRNTGRNGIYVWAATVSGGSCSDITVTGNEVYNPSAENSGGAGIRVDDGAVNVTVTGNTVSAGGTSVLGINVGSTTAARVQHVTVTGNTVKAAPAQGIKVSIADHVALSGNTVSGAGTYGIQVVSATCVTVAGNTIHGAVANSGIQVSSATDVAISGNVVTSSAQHNIEVSNLNGGTITGNVATTSGTSCNGIYVYGTSKGVTIAGNEVALSSRSGIRVEDSLNFTITGNVCKNNGTGGSVALSAGIYVTKVTNPCTGHLISGNRCYDDQGTGTQYYGLRIVGAVDTVVIGPNLFAGVRSGGSDFYVDATATNISSNAYKKLAAQTVGATQATIAHGLPYIPQSITVAMTSAGTVWKSATSDATNIYLTADAASRTCDIYVG